MPGEISERLASLRGESLLAELERLDPRDVRGEGLDIGELAGRLDPASLGDEGMRRLLEVVDRLAGAVPGTTMSAIPAGEFARIAAAASDEQLDRTFAKPDLRRKLLDEIFHRMQEHVRAEKIGTLNATVRWRISGGEGEKGFDRYQCTFADGSCWVERDPAVDGVRPRVTITVSPVGLVRIVTAQAVPAVLFVTGKLRVHGDLAFAAGLIGYFDLPRP